MKDFDLDAKLKSAPVPERSEEYWADFPARVRVQLHHVRSESAIRKLCRPRLSWVPGFGVALAMILVFVQYHPLKAASVAITQQQRQIHLQWTRFDAGLHVLVLNTDGMGYLLTEPN